MVLAPYAVQGVHAWSATAPVALFVAGALWFKRRERGFADVI